MGHLSKAELFQITESDLAEAVKDYLSGTVPDDFRDSTRFDLLVEGERRLPPKAIVSLAGRRPHGRVLSPHDFSGGEDQLAAELLRERGYALVTKPKSVGDLDATFSVGRDQHSEFLLFESRGPDRNTQYEPGLDSVLQLLAEHGVTIADAIVDSRAVAHLPEDKRRLLPDSRLPLQLSRETDAAALGAELRRTAASVGREPGAKGDGNRTKRLRIRISTPGRLSLWDLSEALAGGAGEPNGITAWALLCNPSTYDIERASTLLDEDYWVLPSGDPLPGDRLVLWKAKGRGSQRGVIALGEVLDAPQLLPINEKSKRFWLAGEPIPGGNVRQIRLRYVLPPRAPLWEGEPGAEVLSQLSVSRAQGNKLYSVDQAQWQALLTALGGWPATAVAEGAASGALDEAEKPSAGREGQGFVASPARRRAIEKHAMDRARAYFEGKGYEVEDTSATKPYDLVASKDSEQLFVEVKGTSGSGDKVFLTRNEVAHTQRHAQQSVLFVVFDIEVVESKGREPSTGGGQTKILWPWSISDDDLSAITFEYTLR